ncbi:hypothetical protein F3Y22_tig00016725pilonHSYRG00147 [Hibiscus syriacus]|uniref:Uncharacterized protein n=1 Tax=Hibiscus syriacus TaxID=106335 RepID=A0A6A3BWZ3_HIBSY|nr:classical arabinogalactan protein 26-like [Hibiscus syriacus]KAE8721135.1 hypothetical protein F3Y22_tig00016725pilonHSYRG00147 [Hibiscus syriacus]
MDSLWSPWRNLFVFLMAYLSSVALSSSPWSPEHIRYLTISAALAILPSAPLASSASLPPNIEPLFPTPNGVVPSPTDSSVPMIPSSPSPLNPDDILAPAPGFAISPADPLPVSTSVYPTSPCALESPALFIAVAVWCVNFCLVQPQLAGVVVPL